MWELLICFRNVTGESWEKYGWRQDFPLLSLPAKYQLTLRGSWSRSQHSKECLTLAMGPKGLSHRITNFTHPTSTLPGLYYITSITISIQAGGREAKNRAWGPSQVCLGRERQRPLTYAKKQADLVPPQHWQQKNFPGTETDTASFHSGKSLSILWWRRSKRQWVEN